MAGLKFVDTPIAVVAHVPYVLVVNAALPVHSVADLVKLARDKPGTVSFASPGPGTFHHLNAELFRSIFGLKLIHVPYKGTLPGLNDVIGGHVDFMFADLCHLADMSAAGDHLVTLLHRRDLFTMRLHLALLRPDHQDVEDADDENEGRELNQRAHSSAGAARRRLHHHQDRWAGHLGLKTLC